METGSKIIFNLFVIFTCGITQAQEVKITRLDVKGSNIHIHYELLDQDLDRRYALHLYSSTDNYVQPLELVEGDIGVDIAVGGNKEVVWKAKEELGDDFAGNVSLELKGTLYIPFITLDGFENYKVLKRGKPYDVTWSGGRGDNVLQFELYKGNTKIKVFEERPNVGNTVLTIPTDVKPGKTYLLKISDTRNRDEVVYSGTFMIKRKVPLVLKTAVGLAAVGIAAILVKPPEPTEENDIPDPPNLQ